MSVNSAAMAVIQQLLVARMLTPAVVNLLLDPTIAPSTVDTIHRLLEAGMLTPGGLAALLGLDLTESHSVPSPGLSSAPPGPVHAPPGPGPGPPVPQATFPLASQVVSGLPISVPLPIATGAAHPAAPHAPLLPTAPHLPTQSMPPPILSLYQSPAQMLQSLGPTTTSSSLSTSFTPHQSGLSQIAHRLDSRGADRQRREHAAGIRIEDGEPKKKRKKRSKAVDKPRLDVGVEGAKMEDFLQNATGTNGQVELVMNISLQGRLPFPDKDTRNEYDLPNHLTHYVQNDEAFFKLGNLLGLNHEFSLIPVSTTISDLLQHTANQIRKKQVVLFSQSSSSSIFGTNANPLQLLSFTNWGRAIGGQSPRLHLASLRAGCTLGDLISGDYKRDFLVKKYSFTQKKFFLLSYIITDPDTKIRSSLQQICLGPSMRVKMHTCASIKLYALFKNDLDALVLRGVTDFTEEQASCQCLLANGGATEGNADSDSDSEDEVAAMVSPIQESQPLHLTHTFDYNDYDDQIFRYYSTSPVASGSGGSSRALQTQAPLAVESVNCLNPSEIGSAVQEFTSLPDVPDTPLFHGQVLWTDAWVAPAVVRSTFHNSNRSEVFYKEAELAYRRLSSTVGEPRMFNLQGADVEDLATQYIELVRTAFNTQDFTYLLAKDREFIIFDTEGNYVSSGTGVERECIYTAFKTFTSDSGKWFSPVFGDFSTIVTTVSYPSEHVSQERLVDLGILGALSALSLVVGSAPLPLSPLLIQYLIDGCDIRSVSQAKVTAYFPELAWLILQFLRTSPSSPLDPAVFASHFITYHNLQLGPLAVRDAESHRILAYRILHNALFGSMGVESEEFQAFLRGFELAVPNGRKFTEIARSFYQGSSGFLSTPYQLFNNPEDRQTLLNRFRFKTELDDEDSQTLDLAWPVSLADWTFKKLFEEFIGGYGFPCPALFDRNFRGSVNTIVPLEEVDDPSFRVRSFLWAVGGVPFVAPSSLPPATIVLVSDDNIQYRVGQHSQEILDLAIACGTFSWRTCAHEVRVPASYLIYLLKADYDHSSELNNAQTAINHWLFVQIVQSIGIHTMA